MTGDTLINLYTGKIIGLQDLDDHFVAPLQLDRDQLRQDVYGAGGALDARAVITVAVDELTLSADVEGYTPLGKRLLLDASETEWISTPFEDSGATVYSVGARHIDVPVAAQDGIDGLPHFSHFVERVGLTLSPVTVALDGGGGLLLTMTGNLPLGSRWSVSTESRPVVVWFEDANGDPASKSTVLAIESVSMVRNVAAFEITTANRFGQATPSLDPARYKVALLGPTIYTAAELPGNYATDFLDLGTITSGVFSNALAPLINNLGGTVVAFNAQHDSVTGVHLNVTADRIQSGTPLGLPAIANGDVKAERVVSNASIFEPTADSASVAPVIVRQADGTAKIELRSGLPTANGGGGELHFPSPEESLDQSSRISFDLADVADLRLTNLNAGAAFDMRLIVDGRIRKNAAKTGVPFAIQADDAADETLTLENVGAGGLNVDIPGGNFTLNGSITSSIGNITATVGNIAGNTFSGPSSLWSASALGVVDVAELTGPLVTIDPAASALGYAYDTAVDFDQDYHPIMGGWEALELPGTVKVDYVTGGTPPYIRPDTLSQNLTIRIPLLVPNLYRSSPAAPLLFYRIKSIDIRYRKVNAGDTLNFRLKRLRRDFTGSEAIVTGGQVIPATSAVDATASTGVLDHDMNRSTFAYFMEITMNAGTAIDDLRVMNVQVFYSKRGVE